MFIATISILLSIITFIYVFVVVFYIVNDTKKSNSKKLKNTMYSLKSYNLYTKEVRNNSFIISNALCDGIIKKNVLCNTAPKRNDTVDLKKFQNFFKSTLCQSLESLKEEKYNG